MYSDFTIPYHRHGTTGDERALSILSCTLLIMCGVSYYNKKEFYYTDKIMLFHRKW